MMARLRWMRKSPEERQDFIKKLNSTRKDA